MLDVGGRLLEERQIVILKAECCWDGNSGGLKGAKE
jgi:hypothetical protein